MTYATDKRIRQPNLGSVYQHANAPYPSDAFDEEFDTDPTAGWTWLNQSTASVDVADDALTLYDDRDVNDVSFIGKAPPSGDWTVETMIYPWASESDNRSGAFLAVRYGSTVNTLGHYIQTQLRTLTFGSNGTGGASSQSTTFSVLPKGPIFVRAEWDDTTDTLTWSASLSGNANSFWVIHSFSPGSTPDLVGLAGIWNRNHLIGYTFEYLRRIS